MSFACFAFYVFFSLKATHHRWVYWPRTKSSLFRLRQSLQSRSWWMGGIFAKVKIHTTEHPQTIPRDIQISNQGNLMYKQAPLQDQEKALLDGPCVSHPPQRETTDAPYRSALQDSAYPLRGGDRPACFCGNVYDSLFHSHPNRGPDRRKLRRVHGVPTPSPAKTLTGWHLSLLRCLIHLQLG